MHDCNELPSLVDQNLKLVEENNALKAALQVYANEENWNGNEWTGIGSAGAFDHVGKLIASTTPFAIAKDILGKL